MNSKKDQRVALVEVGISDHRFPFASIKMWLSYFKHFESSYLTPEQNIKINNTYNFIELFTENDAPNYLAVLQKK